MKNLLLILSIFSLAFVACNGGGETTDATTPEVTDETATAGDVSTETINIDATEGELPEATGPFAALAFEKTDHDFGVVNEGEKVTYVFTFTNSGETDLVISNAKGSCGCTVPNYPKEPIAPGETGEITVEYNSKGKSGVQKKNVTITANTNPSTTILNISADVFKEDTGEEEAVPVPQ